MPDRERLVAESEARRAYQRVRARVFLSHLPVTGAPVTDTAAQVAWQRTRPDPDVQAAQNAYERARIDLLIA